MIRILFFVAVILAIGLGLAWVADRPGEMILVWEGQRAEMSLLTGIALVTALIVAVVLVWWLILTLVRSPHVVKRHLRLRRRDRGYAALSSGLIAAGAGDAILARKMTRRTRSMLSADKEPLIHVLEAQTYMIEGRHDDARAKFETMAEQPKTRALGLRGLYLEARRLGASEAAQHYAERAVEKEPHLPWAGQAALEYRTRDGKWDDAIRLLERQRASRLIDRPEAERKQAVLLTARAMDLLESNPRQAASDARQAVRLAPTLVPAAVTAAKALYRLSDLRRGSRLLERVWKASPHPEVADTYIRARAGDSVQDRLRRARRLEALKPNHPESLRIVAKAALDAHDYRMAREKAEAALRIQPRERIYLLLADIEEAETGDQSRVRHWMTQALRAPRDPAWTAEGYVSDVWAPLSPVTGALDAFVWKVPVEQLSGPQIEDGEAPAKTADDAIRSLPPVHDKPAATAPERPTPPSPGRSSPAAPPAPSAAPAPAAPAPAAASAPTSASLADASAAAMAGALDVKAGESKASSAVVVPPPAKDEASDDRPRAEHSAVVIPLQQPAKAEVKPGPTAVVSDSKPEPVKEPTPESSKNDSSKKKSWYGRAPAVAEPVSAVSTSSNGTGAVTKDGSGRAETASTPSAAIASTGETTEADSTSAIVRHKQPLDPDRTREERFLTHRIDDPGVAAAKAEQKENTGSRFRLF